MAGVNNIFGAIEAGLNAEGLRQKTIANNIANMETPGYRRVDVKFGELLAQAMDDDGDIDLSEVEAEIYRPGNTAINAKNNDVNLETEIGQMVKNSLKYKTYIRLLQKKYQQIDLAIDVR